jgi:hypothetical protein
LTDKHKQLTLDLLLPIVQKQGEEIRTIKKAVRELREGNAFYQAREGVQRERAEKLNQALLAVKSQLILQHQSVLWHDNEGRFASLRREIYVCFKRDIFPSWGPLESPDGVYWKDAFEHARIHHSCDCKDFSRAWCLNLDGATYRRRLNELADKKFFNPRLLKWIRPGYYLLNDLIAVTEAQS